MTTQTSLPKIVKFTGITDAGEYGNATCPHCGADGRYVYLFVTEDGERRGAMKGCLGKFPQHPFAKRHQYLLEKGLEYDRKGWNLPSWDKEILAAIDDFAVGSCHESEAKARIARADANAASYRKKKFGR